MKTVILLRHADIDIPPGPAPNDWPLNENGLARAEELLHVVGAAGVTAVFASPASRTQQTAELLVAKLGLPLTVHETPAKQVPHILAEAAGNVVLVVGHSNTVPEIISRLGVPFAGPPLDGHDDLFVVTVVGAGTASVVRLKYGSK